MLTSDLSSAVAAEPLQVLSVGQVVGQPAVLQGDPGVDEGGRTAVVVHKEVLENTECSGHCSTHGARAALDIAAICLVAL